MLLGVLCSCVAGGMGLYTLYHWIIPTLLQYHTGAFLFWYVDLVPWVRDTLTGTTCPERILAEVQKKATRGDARSVVDTIDRYCRSQEWAMNVGDEKGCILDSILCEVKPGVVLELGTYCGYSAVRIASMLPPKARLITLEFNPAFAAIARQVIAWAGVEDKVVLIEGPSGDWIPKMKKELGLTSLDLVFLDHWKDCYLPDTKLMEECSLLRAGSVLVADNVICPGAPEYLEYVRNSPRYQSKYFKAHLEYARVEDGLEKSIFLG